MRLLILTLLLVFTSLNEGKGAQLNRISKTQSSASIQIYTYFDELPLYRQRLSGRRLDLTFFNTNANEGLQVPKPDDVVVKTLVAHEQGKTILSVFFRYIPQDLVINTDQSDTLIVDLVPGNRFTGTYRELRTSLGRVSPVSENRQTMASPLTFSPYRDNWLLFFENFNNAPFLLPLPRLYFPPFPLTSLAITGDAAAHGESLPFIEGLDQNDWFESLRLIQQRLKSIKKDKERKYYALAHADILFRLGSVEAARSQFKLVNQSYKNDIAGDLAIYAGSVIEAQSQQFYKAQTTLLRLLDRLPRSSPLLPYVRLALAEISLATNHYKQMNQHLNSIKEASPSLNPRIELRTADLAFATGRFPDAFRIYRSQNESPEMKEQPFSVNGYCSTLFNQQLYVESSECYQDLVSVHNDEEQLAQALYLATLSAMLTEAVADRSADLFSQIPERYPGTAAALRAKIKQADICMLQQNNCDNNLQVWYRNIADQATLRDIAEEASFKEALVYHLAGDNRTSTQLLSKMLRKFRSGEIRKQVYALLIQILPGEIERLLTERHDIEAIAIAQQNRFLFENGWLNNLLLYRIGLAFENLAMYPEALQLFLYLKKLPISDGNENFHLASTRVAHALGDYSLVEDLAAEYFYRFPEGEHQFDVLFYRLDSRYGAGQIPEALKLLPVPLPQRDDFRFIAASLYFHQNDYTRTADLLLPVYQTRPKGFSSDHLYMLAESLFKLDYFNACAALFEKLATMDGYQQSASYRLAQLAAIQGKKEAVHIPVAESYGSDEEERWHRFAIQDLRYKELLLTL